MSVKDDIHIPDKLYYTQEHEWAFIEEDGTVRIGITDYAQKRMHEVVFVDLPKLGLKVERMGILGTVESVKAVSEVYSPFSGEVVRVNDALTTAPELVNQDPYGRGWIAVIKPINLQGELATLLTAQQYRERLRSGRP
jgi:glycine cleavage system H protein